MKKIVYEYESPINGDIVNGAINVKCFCPGVVSKHKRKIARLGKIIKWEYFQ